MDELETSQEAIGSKLDRVVKLLSQAFATVQPKSSSKADAEVELANPVMKNAVSALHIIKNAVNLEDKV